jgi:hypothetical protein
MDDGNQAYLGARECLMAIRRRVDELTKGVDPAPWYRPVPRPHDNEPADVRQMAIYQRADRIFIRAMLTGSLRGWFVDGEERWQIPGWAWADQGCDWLPLIDGSDFLHPLAPPEVRRWARRPVLVDEAEFEPWLVSDELMDQTGFPELPPAHDEASRPPYVTCLEPPHTPNVSLSHAVSWVAFGISLDSDTLFSALCRGSLGDSRADARRRLERATELLLTAGTGGLPFLGKFVPTKGEAGRAYSESIPAARLENFRQFDVLTDGLHFGRGVRPEWDDTGAVTFAPSDPLAGDKYVDVKVNRRELMHRFPQGPQRGAPIPFIPTGSPGAPTAKAAILQIFRERCETGEVLPSLKAEAEAVAMAYATDPRYPPESGWPAALPQTVRNNIRGAYNAHKARPIL